MTEYVEAMQHGELRELFPDVFFVTGTMKGIFNESLWQFSRNMTVIREGGSLTLFNTVRLDDPGLAALEELGSVENIVRLGALHGQDDEFYRDRYQHASYWVLAGFGDEGTANVGKQLTIDGPKPVSDCQLFLFEETNLPEGILILNRNGGIAIAVDALQNWEEPDEYFSAETKELMSEMGFFTRANVGPVWMQLNEPKAADFERLQAYKFEHALCGHGQPLINGASASYQATFNKLFGI